MEGEQVHTHTQIDTDYNKLNGDKRFHVYCMCENRPTDSLRLQSSGAFQSVQERRGGGAGGGLKQTEPQLVWVPNGAPGSPTKHSILL